MKRKKGLLIVALALLFSFVSLFVGAGISRNRLKKELAMMQSPTDARTSHEAQIHLLEQRNEVISRIIGRDNELDSWFESLHKE